jgi:hypothetical protein
MVGSEEAVVLCAHAEGLRNHYEPKGHYEPRQQAFRLWRRLGQLAEGVVCPEEEVVLRERAEGVRDHDQPALRLLSGPGQLGGWMVGSEEDVVLRQRAEGVRHHHHRVTFTFTFATFIFSNTSTGGDAGFNNWRRGNAAKL